MITILINESFFLFYNFIGRGVKLIQILCEH